MATISPSPIQTQAQNFGTFGRAAMANKLQANEDAGVLKSWTQPLIDTASKNRPQIVYSSQNVKSEAFYADLLGASETEIDHFDTDNSGGWNLDEVKVMVRQTAEKTIELLSPFLVMLPSSTQQTLSTAIETQLEKKGQQLFTALDSNEDGEISVVENAAHLAIQDNSSELIAKKLERLSDEITRTTPHYDRHFLLKDEAQRLLKEHPSKLDGTVTTDEKQVAFNFGVLKRPEVYREIIKEQITALELQSSYNIFQKES